MLTMGNIRLSLLWAFVLFKGGLIFVRLIDFSNSEFSTRKSKFNHSLFVYLIFLNRKLKSSNKRIFENTGKLLLIILAGERIYPSILSLLLDFIWCF